MVKLRADTSRLSARISEFIGATGKEVAEEMARQGKFLAYELASVSPPAAKGSTNGLSPQNKQVSERKIRRALEFFIRKKTYSGGTWSIAQIAAENDPSSFQSFAASGDWYKGALNGQTLSASAGASGGAIVRIMEAARSNPALALKNLRQYLKNQVAEIEALYKAEFKNDPAAITEAYYKAIGNRSKGRKAKVVRVGGPQGGEGNTNRARAAIRRRALASVGGIKAGWVQAGDALPATISTSPPSWLSAKKSAGRGSFESNGMSSGFTIGNRAGNPSGIEDRTNYVEKAINNREQKVLFALEGAIQHLARKKFPK